MTATPRFFKTQEGPKAIGPYSTAVITGGMAYLSGMIPVDPSTGDVVPGGITAETKRVLDNVKLVLGELGLALSDVVKTTIFLADMGDFAKVNEIYGKAFAEPYPARSCVQVAALPKDVRVEIEIVAKMTEKD